jgi:hypothetical protein
MSAHDPKRIGAIRDHQLRRLPCYYFPATAKYRQQTWECDERLFHGGIIDARSAPSSGYIQEVENGNNAVFGNNDNRAVLVDCVIGVFQLWHLLRQNCRKI